MHKTPDQQDVINEGILKITKLLDERVSLLGEQLAVISDMCKAIADEVLAIKGGE
jgi:hypothetical protein